jgi:NhaP-type Na+/H+ or K+/H+ antiporter
MWLAGLRGAMAYALALKSTFDFEKGPIMLIATLIYAFLSILGVGSFMTPILDKIGVTRDHTTSSKQDAIIKTINNHVIHAMPQ